jgi:phosphoribosyl 1,2-cyclic phosphodiesterase
MIRYAVLGTGSNGNSYVFTDGNVSVLVDQGYSLVELKRRLSDFRIDPATIAAVFVTHLHPDHAKGLGVISRRLGVPVYIHDEACEKEATVLGRLAIPEPCLKPVEALVPVTVGPFVLSCFPTSHDSQGSVGWTVRAEGMLGMVLTDTGCVTALQGKLAGEADVLFLEANYDEQLLRDGPYPYYLKQRISGSLGHLSNDQALAFLAESGFNGKHVYFIHLSDVNNNPTKLSEHAGKDLAVPFTVCEKGKCYAGVMERS